MRTRALARICLSLLLFDSEASRAWVATHMRKKSAAVSSVIAQVGTPQVYSGYNDTNAVVTRPPGIVSGNVLYAFFWLDVPSGAASITPPSGWTLVANHTNTTLDGGRTQSLIILRKFAGGSEPASYTFTYSASADYDMFSVVAYSGVNATTPEDVTPVYTEGSVAGSSVSTSTISLQTNGARVVAIVSEANGSDTLTPPAGFAADVLNNDTSLTQQLSVYGRNLTPASTVGPYTFSGLTTGKLYSTILFALRPQ